MEYNKRIADMLNNDDVEGFYILKDASLKLTANGKPFLNALISDCSGEISIKVWDYNGPVDSSCNGEIIKIRGSVSEYRGNLQITVSQIRKIREGDHYELDSLVPAAPIHKESAVREINSIISSIEDADYRKVAEQMLAKHQDKFYCIPAAKSVHHAFLNGLLMHTYNMLTVADFLASIYAEVINRSLLLTGTLLHDFAKEEEFSFSPYGLVTDYSVKGKLLGHLVMGAQEIARVCESLDIPEEKSVLLQHLILSHHGEPEYGAAVIPQCAEAELLSYIDQIDSRMEIYAETFELLPVGQFSDKIYALEKKVYNHGIRE